MIGTTFLKIVEKNFNGDIASKFFSCLSILHYDTLMGPLKWNCADCICLAVRIIVGISSNIYFEFITLVSWDGAWMD